MTPIEIIAQVLSIFGMIVSVLSFQQKKQSSILAMQVCSTIFFGSSFFLLGAYIGAILNGISCLRAILFLYKDKTKADSLTWLLSFIAVYVIIYVLTFVAFGTARKPINFIIEILPIIGMTAYSIAFRKNSPKATRYVGFISSPCWLVYNIFYFSIGAIIGELLNLTSVIVGVIRLDLKKKPSSEVSETVVTNENN